MRIRMSAAIVALLCLAVSGAGRGDQPQWPGKYDIVPIEVTGRTEVRAINDAGMVAGVAFGKDGGLRGFVFYPKGHLIRATGQIVPAPKGVPEVRELHRFRTPGGAEPLTTTAFEPLTINNRLLVAGRCWGGDGKNQFLVGNTDRDEAETTPAAGLTLLHAGLNQKGDAVFGHYRWDAPADRRLRPAPVDLTPWVCDLGFEAEAINDQGLIAGSMTTDGTHGTS